MTVTKNRPKKAGFLSASRRIDFFEYLWYHYKYQVSSFVFQDWGSVMAQASGVGKKGRYLELKRILEERPAEGSRRGQRKDSCRSHRMR